MVLLSFVLQTMSQIVYLNGRFLPLSKAVVSIEDRGFTLGDGIYEVIAVIQGTPIDLDLHLKRLNLSLKKVKINFEEDSLNDEIASAIDKLLQINKGDYKIYIQITRGAAPRNHIFPENSKPTLLVQLFKHSRPKYPCEGISCVLAEDIRWLRKDIKSISLLANVLLKQHAKENNAHEAILYKRDRKIVTEGAASNIFIVDREENIITHPANNEILHGATRARVIDLALQNNLNVIEREFTVEELWDASEIFATTSGFFVNGICKVNETLINNAKIGKMTRILEKLFNDYINEQIKINEKAASCTI